jgi:hypothetical protein
MACDRCRKVNVDMAYGSICAKCGDAILSAVISEYQEQVDAGVPFERRYLNVPREAVRSAPLSAKVRKAVNAIDRPRNSRLSACI